MDLATLMQQAAALNKEQEGMAQQVSALQTQAAGIATESAESLKKAAVNTYEAELTRLEGELATQNARVKAANAFGTNVNDVSDIITGIAGQMRETALQMVAAQQEVQRIEANSDLFGNPIGWLEDLVRGDEVRAQASALEKSFDLQSKLAQNLNAATQSTAQTQNAISESLSATSINQIAQAKAAVVQKQAADAAIEAARYGSASIEVLMNQGSQAFNRNMSMYNAAMQAESMRLAREERAARLAEKAELEQEIQTIADNVNTYNRQVGKTEMPVSFIKRFYGTSGAYGEELRHADVAGMRIKQGATEGILGGQPAEVYSRVIGENLQLPPAWNAGVTVLQRARDEMDTRLKALDKTTGKPVGAGMKGEDLAREYNRTVEDVAKGLQAKIDHGTGNPFQAPGITAVLQSQAPDAQALATSNFRKAVLDPLVAVGNTNPSPELLMATSLSAIERGELSMKEAVEGGTAYFDAAKAVNLAAGGFTTMAIPVTPGYMADAKFLTKEPAGTRRVDFGVGGIGGGLPTFVKVFNEEQRGLRQHRVQAIDLTNSADYTTALNILMAQRRAQQILDAKGSGMK